MEGVIVIARRHGSPVLTAVTTNADGWYAFPRERLAAGRYTVDVRAAGFELPRGALNRVAVTREVAVTLDLGLVAVTDADKLAAQMTNLDWFRSMPGTPAQKTLLVRAAANCGFCHTLERIMRSKHDAREFRTVIQRMLTYDSDYSSGDRAQIVASPPALTNLNVYGNDGSALADYLATVNLSGGRTTWPYPLTFSPRPTGRATRAIVTVFPIPRQHSLIHDLDVDSKGNVWYGNSGWDYIGRLNPKSGKFAEWPAPNFLPPGKGFVRRRGVLDIQVDTEDNVWAAIAGPRMGYFNPRTATWRTFGIPVATEVSGFISPFRKSGTTVWTMGTTGDADGLQRAFRLHTDTGKVDGPFQLLDPNPPRKDPRRVIPWRYCYMMERDADDNFLCTNATDSNIIRVDAATGTTSTFPTPTPWAYPRRGYIDARNRFWFGEFYVDKLGMFDLSTNEFREFPLGPEFISPYYARPDQHGEIWLSSNGSDRLLRVNSDTGEATQYLMPVYYDARKVVVDRAADRTTIWLPNKNAAQIIRVEVPD